MKEINIKECTKSLAGPKRSDNYLKCQREGFNATSKGLSLANPYQVSSEEFDAWEEGLNAYRQITNAFIKTI